jgi:hypothetical protein
VIRGFAVVCPNQHHAIAGVYQKAFRAPEDLDTENKLLFVSPLRDSFLLHPQAGFKWTVPK